MQLWVSGTEAAPAGSGLPAKGGTRLNLNRGQGPTKAVSQQAVKDPVYAMEACVAPQVESLCLTDTNLRTRAERPGGHARPQSLGWCARYASRAQSSRAVLQRHYTIPAAEMQALMCSDGVFTSVGNDPGVACLCHSHPTDARAGSSGDGRGTAQSKATRDRPRSRATMLLCHYATVPAGCHLREKKPRR